MNPELYKIAANASLDVYENNISIGWGTQISYSIVNINGVDWQIIATAGTNGFFLDLLKNINILSWCGIKLSAYRAAGRINKYIKAGSEMPLMLTGHSLGGAAMLAYKKRFGADACIVFAPANVFRRWSDMEMSDTVIFIDPDDPVTQLLGKLSFGLPTYKVFKAEKNHVLWSFKDHPMSKWVKFVINMLKNGGLK